jgi:hypothetical protein
MKDMPEYLKTALSIPPKFVRHGKTAGASKKKPASKKSLNPMAQNVPTMCYPQQHLAWPCCMMA